LLTFPDLSAPSLGKSMIETLGIKAMQAEEEQKQREKTA
jgi:hypothetical protein